jgi:nitrite reductase (NADH) small subunit
MVMSEFVKVAESKDVPAGTGVCVEIGGKAIAVFNCNGTFLAMDDTCPHQGGPLGEGELAGTVVTCPWHEWRFDVRTGVNTEDATCAVRTYPVKLEGGDVLVEV